MALDGLTWFENPVALATAENVDVVVELMGGSGGPALALAEAAIARRRPLVTANKALIAVHGAALAEAAEAAETPIAFEAAVAGGIPVIKALREGLAANRISRVAGILNGTCNYILTAMREQKREFADVLAEAQALGYAEADPSFDIDGVDAAHKLAILAALAFGPPGGVRRGACGGHPAHHRAGHRLCRRAGLPHQAAGDCPAGGGRRGDAGASLHGAGDAPRSPGWMACSTPWWRRAISSAASCWKGGGLVRAPTASAVVADLIDLARGRLTPSWGAALAALGPR